MGVVGHAAPSSIEPVKQFPPVKQQEAQQQREAVESSVVVGTFVRAIIAICLGGVVAARFVGVSAIRYADLAG